MLNNLLKNEGVKVAIVTAAVYLTAYQFDKSYLKHFGISDTFVSISIERLALTFSVILISAIVISNFFWILPKGFIRKIAVLVVFFTPTNFLVAASIVIYFIAGWSWILIAVLLVALLAISFNVLQYMTGIGSDGSANAFLERFVQEEGSVQDRMEYFSILKRMEPTTFWLLMFLVFFPPTAGDWSGDWYAKQSRNYNLLEEDSAKFALVAKANDLLFFVKIKLPKDGTEVVLGENEIISLRTSSSQLDLRKYEVARLSFARAERDIYQRVSFAEFAARELSKFW